MRPIVMHHLVRPIVTPRRIKFADRKNYNEICKVCLLEIKDNKVVTECGHFFHYDCIFCWKEFNNKCPICKNSIGKITRFF
jgi:hypothetical protein